MEMIKVIIRVILVEVVIWRVIEDKDYDIFDIYFCYYIFIMF